MGKETRPEILFARALLAVEPKKVRGGSPARQSWLGLVMEVQIFLHRHNLSYELFRDALLNDDRS